MPGFSHGLTATPIHWVWIQMRQRCSNPRNESYKDYGARGIIVCEDWMNFEKFNLWAINNGYRKGLMLERKDNNKGYSPDNCCWTTRQVQNRNSRHNRVLEIFGERKSMSEWAEDARCKTTYTGLRKRLSRGWASEAAVTTPRVINQYR